MPTPNPLQTTPKPLQNYSKTRQNHSKTRQNYSKTTFLTPFSRGSRFHPGNANLAGDRSPDWHSRHSPFGTCCFSGWSLFVIWCLLFGSCLFFGACYLVLEETRALPALQPCRRCPHRRSFPCGLRPPGIPPVSVLAALVPPPWERRVHDTRTRNLDLDGTLGAKGPGQVGMPGVQGQKRFLTPFIPRLSRLSRRLAGARPC
jgi:hypothetical protein